jgi:RimJ/RimL family protein N-acetyltransferase
MRTSFDGVFGELTTLPGSSQIVVSHGVYTPKYRRGKGFGKSALKKRLEFCSVELGYDYIICTVREDNTAEQRVLGEQGFFRLDKFHSSNSGSDILIFGKRL